MKTFINSIGVWELQEDGTIRLISEIIQKDEREKVKKNARSGERNRVR